MTKRALAALAVFLTVSGWQSAVAGGDVVQGESVFRKCWACHAVGENSKNKVGPVLNGIVGRTAATVEGFRYSSAMNEKGTAGLFWNEETLSAYLSDPKGYIPKNKMAFAGLKTEDDITNIIAYLGQFSAGGGQQSASSDDASQATSASPKGEEAEAETPPEFTEAFLNDQTNYEIGKEIWGGQCRHCHGRSAYPGKAPKLKPGRYKPDFVFDRVTNGFRKMPAWRDVYSQEERMAIVTFVMSRKFSP